MMDLYCDVCSAKIEVSAGSYDCGPFFKSWKCQADFLWPGGTIRDTCVSCNDALFKAVASKANAIAMDHMFDIQDTASEVMRMRRREVELKVVMLEQELAALRGNPR